MHGDVLMYIAQANVQLDAEIGGKGPFCNRLLGSQSGLSEHRVTRRPANMESRLVLASFNAVGISPIHTDSEENLL